MCIILFAINQHPKYKFIVAANRDEFYERPTARADFWSENPNILAGKDLVHGGTWLGITKQGRFAAVTNFRDPSQPKGEFSRGDLVKDFLINNISPDNYLEKVQENSEKYTGFNLLVGDIFGETDLRYFSNRSGEIQKLGSGNYGLSNHLLDTPWQKVARGKDKFTDSLENISAEILLDILADKTFAPEDKLPDTGIGFEREKLLSSIFIETPTYGTRCSSVLLVGNKGETIFTERNYNGNPNSYTDKTFNF